MKRIICFVVALFILLHYAFQVASMNPIGQLYSVLAGGVFVIVCLADYALSLRDENKQIRREVEDYFRIGR